MKIQTITEDCIRDHDKVGYSVPDSRNMTFNPSVKVVKWQKKRGKESKHTVLGEFVGYNGEIRILLPRYEIVNVGFADVGFLSRRRHYTYIKVKDIQCYLGNREVELSEPLIVGYGGLVMCKIEYKESEATNEK